MFFLFGISKIHSQEVKNITPTDTSKIFKVELTDGSIFFGNIKSKDSLSLFIKTNSIPNLEIPKSKIRSIVEVEKENFKNGTYWFPNSNATRYLFGPSAFSLKKGEGYYQNTYLVLNSFNVGITNNISVGGGIEFISTFVSLALGDFNPIFFVTPKISFKASKNVHAGGGILYANTPSFTGNGRNGLGIVYGIGTYGNADHNLTGGIGWGFVNREFSERPIVTVSGMTRISKKTALVTENWFIPTDNYYNLYSYGIRFFGEKIAIDLAFINSKDIYKSIIIGIPYVDFVVKFN